MNYKEIPKVELHCHLEGCFRPQTVMEVGESLGIDVPKSPDVFHRDWLLSSPLASLEAALARFVDVSVDKVVGVESRGFIFAPMLALQLGAGFVPVRKPGKLPWETVSEEYELEYGTDKVELHVDAVREGERVLIVDDLIATGGTARAATRLVERAGGRVEGLGFVVELAALDGRKQLEPHRVESLVVY